MWTDWGASTTPDTYSQGATAADHRHLTISAAAASTGVVVVLLLMTVAIRYHRRKLLKYAYRN